MASKPNYDTALAGITRKIVDTYDECGGIHHLNNMPLPSYREVVEILADLRELIYPGYGRRQNLHMGNVVYHAGDLIESLYHRLSEQITGAFRHNCQDETSEEVYADRARSITIELLDSLPAIRRVLALDVQAAYDGDPAAKNLEEILFCYPGVAAVTIFRVAHKLNELGAPLIPRMMTEYAHSKTGIDVHPGATIGNRFFIDHGTGVVIGETTLIGDNVKIYQGVTLVCLVFPGTRRRARSSEGSNGTRRSRTTSSFTPMRLSWAARRPSAKDRWSVRRLGSHRRSRQIPL